MNNDADEPAKRNLKSWEDFLHIYCTSCQRSCLEVIADPVLVELLNILWLRSREKAQPIGSK